MKKIFLIITVIMLSISSFYAQTLKFGLKAGLNYANVSGSSVQTDAITSYHVGVISEIKVSEKFSVQPELIYSTQGATYKTILQDYKNELGYISIPVLAKIYLSDSFSLELGPQASFLLNEKNNFSVQDSNTFDFAVNGGLSYKVTKNFFLSGRYGLGLTEIKTNSNIKNSVLQVSAGFLF